MNETNKPILNPVGVEINNKFEGHLNWNFKLKDFLQADQEEEEFYSYSQVIHAGEQNGKKISWKCLFGTVDEEHHNSHWALTLIFDYTDIGDASSFIDSDSSSSDCDDSEKFPTKFQIIIDEVLIGDSAETVQLQRQHILETEHDFSANDPYFAFQFKKKKYPNTIENLENTTNIESEQLQLLEFRCKIKLHFNGQNFKCEKQKCLVDNMRNIETCSTDEFSDFDIKVNGTVFKKHKIILAKSAYFRSLFKTDMVESAQSSMEIEDFSSQIVSKMLDYIYSGQIISSNGADGDVDGTGQDLELHRIADKYGILDLKQELESKIASNISIEKACEIFRYADVIGCKELKENAIKFIINNMRAVTNTDGFNELKSSPDLLIEICKEISNN